MNGLLFQNMIWKVSGTVTVGRTFYFFITLHVLQLISVHFCLFLCRKIWQRVNNIHVLPTKMTYFPSTVTTVSHVTHWDSYKTQSGLQTYKHQRFLDTIVSDMKIDNWSSSMAPPAPQRCHKLRLVYLWSNSKSLLW